MIPYHDYEGAEYEYPPHEEEPMTNEAWLKSLSTEELANYIATQCADAIRLWGSDCFEKETTSLEVQVCLWKHCFCNHKQIKQWQKKKLRLFDD